MEQLRGATLACPSCGDHLEVIIPSNTPVGTVEKQTCPAGHDFWFRVLQARLDTLAAAP